MPNAYILSWTMSNYPILLKTLKEKGFKFIQEKGEEDISVDVPFKNLDEFTELIQKHLNKEYCYVDVQYPKQEKTAVIFKVKRFMIENKEQNTSAQKWAIEKGLSKEQSDWGVSY